MKKIIILSVLAVVAPLLMTAARAETTCRTTHNTVFDETKCDDGWTATSTHNALGTTTRVTRPPAQPYGQIEPPRGEEE